MNIDHLDAFLGGGICVGELVIAMLFVRFWRRHNDGVFGWFALSFAILALERVLIMFQGRTDHEPVVYVTRLVAYLCVIVAVIARNRRPA